MLSNDRNCFVDQTVGKRDVEISMYMSQVGEITEVSFDMRNQAGSFSNEFNVGLIIC